MSGKAKDFAAVVFLVLLLVLTYFLVIAPGKLDNTDSIAENTAGSSTLHAAIPSGDSSNHTENKSTEKDGVTADVPTEDETLNAEKRLNVAEKIQEACTDEQGTSQETHVTPGGEAQGQPMGAQEATGEIQDIPEGTQGAFTGSQEPSNETPEFPVGTQEDSGVTHNEALGGTNDAPGEAQVDSGEIHEEPSAETQAVPGAMQAADVLKKLYSYSDKLDRYHEALEILSEDFTLQLEVFKQFGFEKLNRGDITGERVDAFAIFLMNSKLKDILREIHEGDNIVIEYIHAMHLGDSDVVELELAADLVTESGMWKIASIRETK